MQREEIDERLQRAVAILVDEHGRIKDRLKVAYISQLAEIPVPADLPDELAGRFDTISFQISTDGRRGDGATVSKELEQMSDGEASQKAREIFNIFLASRGLKELDEQLSS